MKKIILYFTIMLTSVPAIAAMFFEKSNQIDSTSYRSSDSFDDRIRFLIFHYTAVDFKESIRFLTKNQVSAHYLIPDINDPTYLGSGFKKMRIFNLVDENKRAWHAGVSAWAGRNNLNDTSIGIEIVNQATETEGQCCSPPFPQDQINTLIFLSLDILRRNPNISPTQILGHSDIAVARKIDPGPAFPWKTLYDAGIGAWYDNEIKSHYVALFNTKGLPEKSEILEKMGKYGYDTAISSTDEGFKELIRAFQLHFRPANYNGELDIETAAILYALVDKYFPEVDSK